jgi:dihydropteroate synthase
MQHVADRTFTFQFGRRQYELSSRTHIMGILNVTPDSFADGGRYLSTEKAVEHAIRMVEDGADFIDIGGESTRPKGQAYGEGAEPITAGEELERVLPVIEKLVRLTDAPISIDTYKSEVADEALRAGAVIVNDISGFAFDPEIAVTAAKHKASAVLMHIKGTPKTMQTNPVYDDLFGEISASLGQSIQRARAAGVEQIMIDPGIGFGKTTRHNLQLINGLSRFAPLGLPILVGPSRKSFIGTVLDLPVEERLEGTMAAVVACILYGAHIVRVHDVRQCRRAAAIADAIKNSSPA